jgi:hypothetical protein
MALIDGYLVVRINSFIPRDVPGVTELITTGPHAGKTAVSLPPIARFHPLHPSNEYKPRGTGYLTDQRGFSSDSQASCRVQSAARITLYPPRLVTQIHVTSGTTEVNLNSGLTQDRDFADMSDCSTSDLYDLTGVRFEDRTGRLPPGPMGFAQNITTILDGLVKRPQPSGDLKNQYNMLYSMLRFQKSKPTGPWRPGTVGEPYAAGLEIHGEVSDPLVAGSANLDYTVDFVINVDVENSRLLVGVFGLIDRFPAFEAYANFNGFTKTLFQILPAKGSTLLDLVGAESVPVASAVSFP